MTSAEEGHDGTQGETRTKRPRGKARAATATTEQKVAPPAAEDSGDRSSTVTWRIAIAAAALSIISLAVAATSPLWSPKIYNGGEGGRLLILGVAQLRPALLGSSPFQSELNTLYRVAPDNREVRAALNVIAAAAREGIPTTAQLRWRFARIADAIVINEAVPPKIAWIDRALVSLASVVPLQSFVRRFDGDASTMPIVRAAEANLRAGDLAGTVTEVAKLSGRSAEIAAPWLGDARDRLAATETLATLDALASRQLAKSAR